MERGKKKGGGNENKRAGKEGREIVETRGLGRPGKRAAGGRYERTSGTPVTKRRRRSRQRRRPHTEHDGNGNDLRRGGVWNEGRRRQSI